MEEVLHEVVSGVYVQIAFRGMSFGKGHLTDDADAGAVYGEGDGIGGMAAACHGGEEIGCDKDAVFVEFFHFFKYGSEDFFVDVLDGHDLSERIGVVHGDPGPGNYLHRDGALSCIVDWEFTHIGDPEEDWAYLISMRGMGVMKEDDWVRYLRELVGVELDGKRLRYWQALNFFKGVCIDQTAQRIYMDRTNLAPNMLAIGPAVHLSALKQLCGAISAT